jgi:hypothetical protein
MAVSNATVTVNGVAIPWSPADGRYHSYSGTTLGPGSGLTFSATVETLQATAYEIIPPDVVIASPAPGITYTASSLILVCWDPVSPAPDYYGVDVPASHTQSGNAYSISLPGTETDTDLPPGTMLAGYTNLQVSVTARNQSQMAGRAMIGDYFNVGNMSVALFATQ